MSYNRTFDVLVPREIAKENRDLLFGKTGSSYESWNGIQIQQRLLACAQFLKDKNIQKGDMIVFMPESALPEWICLDLAAQAMGIITVLAHATSNEAHLSIILEESEAKHFFYINEDIFEGLQDVAQSIECYNLDDIAWPDPMDLSTYEAQAEKVSPEDISSIIYTSGTTGQPKGVMLTHKNIMSNVQCIALLLPIKSKHRLLSFLPYSHVFERTTVYCLLALKTQIYFIGKVQNLAEALPEIKPHFFTSVPRVLERMYDQVVAEFSARKWLGKKMILWAGKLTEKYQPHKGFKPLLHIQFMFIRHILLRKFRQKMGGNIESIIVGAAHLRPEIARAFFAAGVKVREGYGMTETSPVISFNRFEPGLSRMDTVGLLLPNVKLIIKDEQEDGSGEIWVKGPNVMKGYFKRPEETSAKFDGEGWFNTGDVGRFIDGKFLQITDRKKDIFKTSSGKYIAPQELEQHFNASDLFQSVMIIGFQKPYVTALIYPNFEALKRWAQEQNIHWTSPQYMALNIKVKERIQAEIDEYNSTLPNHKLLRNFHLMHREWTIEEGQLSNTLKPIRSKIITDYQSEIDDMYN